MSGDSRQDDSVFAGARELPLKALVIMIVLAWGVMLGGLLGWRALPLAMVVLATDGVMALMVLLAAGGYGYAIYRRFAPAECPRSLGLVTAAALGLWLLSMAVLAVGSLLPAALTMYVWWPVVGVGVALGLWQAHRGLADVHLPARLGGDSLVWVLVAAGAGLWLAGAMTPAGWLGRISGVNPAMPPNSPGNIALLGADSSQLLACHLQLPREFHQAGHIRTLTHNVYSHFPLGTQMLQLLGMCLRGGAYQGMYLARLIGGLFAVLTVAGAAGGLRDDNFRARAATALLATAPWVIYLTWLAAPEVGSLCYLTLALLWLRRWMRHPAGRTAAWIGIMAGAAAGASYAAAAMVAAPLLLVMLVAALRRRGRLPHLALAAALTAAMFIPWLVRNAAATGNPLFPLATGLLGRGHWDEQTARRWRDAHALAYRPPVPVPPDYDSPPRPTRLEKLAAFGLDFHYARMLIPGRPFPVHPALAVGVLLLLLGTLAGMFVRPRGPTGSDWAVLAVLAMQMLLWLSLAADSPARTASVCLAPLSLLCAGGLARLAGVKQVRWLRQTAGVGGRWGLAPGTLLLVATVVLNFMSTRAYWAAETRGEPVPPGYPAEWFAKYGPEYRAANAAVDSGRLALLGEDRAFYFPAASVYATAFDSHPLAESFRRSQSGQQLAEQLRRAGITHVHVAWVAIEHLSQTVGWPAAMSKARLAELLADWPVVDGFRLVAATRPATATATAPATGPAGGTLVFTLYAVPTPRSDTATATAPSN